MMYKMMAVAAAVAASQLSAVSACGWADEKCCDIPEGRPNQGTCLDARTVCWEEYCSMCGVNGKKGCDSEPVCEDGFLLNDDGWCYNDPNGTPDFSCTDGCADGEACTPWGACEACGGNGQIACDSGEECSAGNEKNEQGYCTNNGTPDFSCTDGCADGEACTSWGACEACGGNGQIACDGDVCEQGSTANAEGYCSTDPHCGWFNEQCCADDYCFEGECDEGSGNCDTVPEAPTDGCDVWIPGKGINGNKLRDVPNLSRDECEELTKTTADAIATAFEPKNGDGSGSCWMMQTNNGFMDAPDKSAWVKC